MSDELRTDELKDRVALVFGAGACGEGWGNGKATAVAYARAGASVVAVDINAAAARETAAVITAEGGRAMALSADVASAQDVEAVVKQTLAHFAHIDIVHNNVGICRPGDPITLSEADWDLSMSCNVKSVFLTAKYVLPIMQRQRRGVITNISSILSVRVSQYDEVAYYASKAAVNHLTKAIAVKFAGDGIRCNAILPGLIHTPLLYANPDVVSASHGGVEAMVRERDNKSPTGKMGNAWDIANAAVFLASDRAAYINGVELPVDGGLICKQA